jgi:hypothetical protein
MSTQGLVSIVNERGETLIKIVAGCNGFNASKLAARIVEHGEVHAELICRWADEIGFGCRDCTVTQFAPGGSLTWFGDTEPGTRFYAEKFADPKFNPRWEQGTASHYVELMADGGKIVVTVDDEEE